MKFVILVVLSLLFCGYTTHKEAPPLSYDSYKADDIKYFIVQTAIRKHINPATLLAMAEVESSYNPRAVNPKTTNLTDSTSIGLFQVKFSTAKYFCKIKKRTDLYNFIVNTNCAVKYLLYQRDRYKDLSKAILAYNAGSYILCNPGHIKKGRKCTIGYPINMPYLISIYSKASLIQSKLIHL